MTESTLKAWREKFGALKPGKHEENGVACVVEAANWLAGNKWNDDHPSLCRAVRGFVVKLNDRSTDEARQLLVPYLTRLLGTEAGREVANKRAWILARFALVVAAPMALDQAHAVLVNRGKASTLNQHAAKLRAEPTRDNALAAKNDAYAAAAAAAAAAAYAAADADAAADAAACNKAWMEIMPKALKALDEALAVTA